MTEKPAPRIGPDDAHSTPVGTSPPGGETPKGEGIREALDERQRKVDEEFRSILRGLLGAPEAPDSTRQGLPEARQGLPGAQSLTLS